MFEAVTTDQLVKSFVGFIIGGLCVSAFSITADRFGSKLSGLLASFPVTLAASLFLLGLSESPEAAVQEAAMIPALMGFFGIFLMVYCLTVRRALLLGILSACAVWGVLAAGLSGVIDHPNVTLSLLIFGACFFLCTFVLEKLMRIPERSGDKSVRLTVGQAAVRMFAGGTIVGGSVLLGSMFGPKVAAAMAAFPAVTIATLIVTYHSGGAELSAAFAKSLMVNGMVSSTALSVAVYLLFQRFDPYAGIALALTAVLISGVCTWPLVRRMA